MPHYTSYRTYLTARFGKPVYKIPVNGGFSCPNRDGTKSTTGCLFCDNRSFSPVARLPTVSPVQQLLNNGKKSRDSGRLLLPYLQPFSNTYGPVAHLRSIYEPLLLVPGVIGLAIGTRPDCFSEETYTYLEDLASRTYLSIELGLQSSHDSTLERCNRGHTFTDFCTAVNRLAQCNIETVAHVILGLPGEDTSMMITTADRLASLPVTGIKIHHLMIIHETEFAVHYEGGTLPVLTLEAYAPLLAEFLEHLRPNQHIHRLCADASVKNGLMAPAWSADKATAVTFLHHYFEKNSIQQGKTLFT